MPDAELPRSDSPNCEVDVLDDGTGVLIAIKDINAGEFFSVIHSDDDDDDDDDDDNDDDEYD